MGAMVCISNFCDNITLFVLLIKTKAVVVFTCRTVRI